MKQYDSLVIGHITKDYNIDHEKILPSFAAERCFFRLRRLLHSVIKQAQLRALTKMTPNVLKALRLISRTFTARFVTAQPL